MSGGGKQGGGIDDVRASVDIQPWLVGEAVLKGVLICAEIFQLKFFDVAQTMGWVGGQAFWDSVHCGWMVLKALLQLEKIL